MKQSRIYVAGCTPVSIMIPPLPPKNTQIYKNMNKLHPWYM